MSKARKRAQQTGTVADQIATFIGRSMAELLNRKDSLTKQLSEVERQIADVRKRVARQFGRIAGARLRRRRGARAAAGAGRKAKRVVSAEARAKMAAAARRRWARVKKGE